MKCRNSRGTTEVVPRYAKCVTPIRVTKYSAADVCRLIELSGQKGLALTGHLPAEEPIPGTRSDRGVPRAEPRFRH
jgi:hypothetical protein